MPCYLLVHSATACPAPQKSASSSIPSSTHTVLSTSKHTASALRQISSTSTIHIQKQMEGQKITQKNAQYWSWSYRQSPLVGRVLSKWVEDTSFEECKEPAIIARGLYNLVVVKESLIGYFGKLRKVNMGRAERWESQTGRMKHNCALPAAAITLKTAHWIDVNQCEKKKSYTT